MPKYTVKPNQNLFDVALHLYGSIEGVFDLLITNPKLSLSTDLSYGQELEYHEEFVLNESIVNEFKTQNIIPSSGERQVYFKTPSAELIAIIGVSPTMTTSTFAISGAGEIWIDWGDNSCLEHITLSNAIQHIEHSFNSVVDSRRIKIYGKNSALLIDVLDTTGVGGSLLLCRQLAVNCYVCDDGAYSLAGLSLFEGTHSVKLSNSLIDDLLPIADMSLNTLDLRGVGFTKENVLDEYLLYVVSHYEDRSPCTVYLTTEPSQIGYEAIKTILGEPEWNNPNPWQFYINGKLYSFEQSNSFDCILPITFEES